MGTGVFVALAHDISTSCHTNLTRLVIKKCGPEVSRNSDHYQLQTPHPNYSRHMRNISKQKIQLVISPNMTEFQPAMPPTGSRFLDFPRELRDAVYTQSFRGKYTVRVPQCPSKQTDFVKASSWPRVAILQTSKQVNEEASQLLYAVGSFCFPSDVFMEKHLRLLGHNFHLLRTIELRFDMDWCNPYGSKESSPGGPLDDTCMNNLRLVAARKGIRRYGCTLVFEDCEMCEPSEVRWWDTLVELDVFEIVAVKLKFEEDKTYPAGKEVNGRSERWEEIKRDLRMYVKSWWED